MGNGNGSMKKELQFPLSLEKLSAGYGKKVVLADADFQLEAGKIYTLIGPNGSGKSTLLKTLVRELMPLGGCIYLDGDLMQKLPASEVAKQMAIVMTERIQTEQMTCRDVVEMGRYPYTGKMGFLTEEDHRIVEEAICLLHAQEVADEPFDAVSDGQRQRIMLARAICQNPHILILDEPTSYLDIRYKLSLLTIIRQVAREKQMTVLLSLHELELARQISDWIFCAEKGKIGKSATVEEVFAGDYLQQLYEIPMACLDGNTGGIYLPGAIGEDGKPVVFVIGGGGDALPLYRKLQQHAVPYAAGILPENDLELAPARAGAQEVITARAFYPVDDAIFEKAKAVLTECSYCICPRAEFGPYEEKQKMLLAYAREAGKLVTEEEFFGEDGIWQKQS